MVPSLLAFLIAKPSPQIGALVPWTTYEAEDMQTNGTVMGPDYSGFSAAREASGRKSVRLEEGQYLSFTSDRKANGLVARFSLPPSPGVKEAKAILKVELKGRTYELPLTSRFEHQYGEYPFSKIAAQGNHRHYWDEVHTLVHDVAKGDIVKLSPGPGTHEVSIDFVDLEQVPAPYAKPKDAVSIVDFGATPDSGVDASNALRAAIGRADSEGKIAWIPPGVFTVKGNLDLGRTRLCGAGMWYSTLKGVDNYTPSNRLAINGTGKAAHLSDFSISGNLNYRNDSEANDGIGGTFGEGSSIQNIWVEHTKTGAWITNSIGLVIKGCRFRDTVADGINLCLGNADVQVVNCTSRGTGDDGFAMWPASYAPSEHDHAGNRFIHCTCQVPYLAQAFSLYGGRDNRVEGCLAQDIPYGAGAMVSTTFPTVSGFAGDTVFENVRIVRAGGNDGAVSVFANMRDIPSVRFANVEVQDAISDGLKFTSVGKSRCLSGLFDLFNVDRAGLGGSGFGLGFSPGAAGSASFEHCVIGAGASGRVQRLPSGFRVLGLG